MHGDKESEEGVGGGAGERTGGEGVDKRAPTGSTCQLHTVTISDHQVLKVCSVASTVPSDHDHLTASPKQPIIVPISQRRKLKLLERKCSPNVNMDQVLECYRISHNFISYDSGTYVKYVYI